MDPGTKYSNGHAKVNISIWNSETLCATILFNSHRENVILERKT